MKNGLFFLMMVALVSCKKDKGTTDTQLPVITMTSPTNNQVFTAGQTVNITGAISDNDKIKELHLEITNTTTGVFLTHENYCSNAARFNLSRSLITPAATFYKKK